MSFFQSVEAYFFLFCPVKYTILFYSFKEGNTKISLINK